MVQRTCLPIGLLVLAGAAMETGYLPGDKIDVVGDIPLRLLSESSPGDESSSGESASGESAPGENEGCDLCSDLCTGQEGTKPGNDANGMCQDGGPGAEMPTCDYGTDCSDCGPRCPWPPPPPAPPVAPPPPVSPPPAPPAPPAPPSPPPSPALPPAPPALPGYLASVRNSDELRDKVASVAAGGEASIYLEPGGVFELTEPIVVSGIRLVLESDGTSGSSARRRRLGRSGRGLDGSGTGTGAILDGGGVSQLLRVTDGASVELRGVHLVNAGGSGNSDGGAAYVENANLTLTDANIRECAITSPDDHVNGGAIRVTNNRRVDTRGA